MNSFASATIIVLLLILGCIYFGFIGFHLIFRSKGDLAKSITAYGPWTLGLPFTAIGAFSLVTLLPAVSGGEPLEFKVLGFEFNGSSSQVILWVICFLAICIGIRVVAPVLPIKEERGSVLK